VTIGRLFAGALLVTISAASLLAALPAMGGTRAKGDRDLGEYLSAECVTCHQISGRYEGIPPIIGWPEDAFIEILTDYREKRRENQVMRTIAAKFSDEEIAALAAYFGSLQPQTR
jgi:cytochrome c553